MITELEWIADIPTGINLEPKTIYYFQPNLKGKELMLFIQRVSVNTKEGGVYRWLKECDRSDNIRYFATDFEMGLDGWCYETTIQDATSFHHVGFNVIDGRTL